MQLATVSAYRLPGDAKLEEVLQRDGSALWAVRSPGGYCLNASGEWEYEPMPSSRDAAFFARCRFQTPQAAYAAWEARKE